MTFTRILTEAERRLAMTDEERAVQRERWGRVHVEGDRGVRYSKTIRRERKGTGL